MSKQSITVTQMSSGSYDANKPEDNSTNAKHTYYVEKCVNTLVVKCKQYLTPDRVQDLIDSGIDVTIIQVK